MNKDENLSLNSDDKYYEQRYRDNWNHAVRRAMFTAQQLTENKRKKRDYWHKNKSELNRRRREKYHKDNGRNLFEFDSKE
jgi:hypothetical protein